MKSFNEKIKDIAALYGYTVTTERHGRRSEIVCTNRNCTLHIAGNSKEGWTVWSDTEIYFPMVLRDCELYEHKTYTYPEYRIGRDGKWAVLTYFDILNILAVN